MKEKTRSALFLYGCNIVFIGLIVYLIGGYFVKNPTYKATAVFDTSVGYGIDFGLSKAQIDEIANTADDEYMGFSLHTGVRFPEQYEKFGHVFDEFSVDCGGDRTSQVRKISLYKYGSKDELESFKKALDTDILNSLQLSRKVHPNRLFKRLHIKNERTSRRLTSYIDNRNGEWRVVVDFELLDGHFI